MRRSIIALWARAALRELRAGMGFKPRGAKSSGLKPPGPTPLDLS